MAKVIRGNVVLHVDERDVQRYVDLGYNCIDDDGNILIEAVPSDIGALRTKYMEYKQKCAELEAEVGRLTAELKKSKKKSAKEAE